MSDDTIDPSQLAYERVKAHLPELQLRACEVMRAIGAPATHDTIIEKWHEMFGKASASTIRTRISELFDRKLVNIAGYTDDPKRKTLWVLV